jgi:heparan-alpha-glucosaminide N-acetyltransferase
MDRPAQVGPPQLLFRPGDRIASIDVARGLTILLMVFVNDIAGVAGLPMWMMHYEPFDADGMTFVDIIFPAFLFIVGMSIPFALGRRLARPGAVTGTLGHVGLRTISLLIIGVFMVNTGNYAAEGAVLSKAVWTLLMYTGVILVWAHWPFRGLRPAVRWALTLTGVAFLIVAAVLFRGPGEVALIELRTQWWGILGLIGWAYLVGCVAFLAFRSNLTALAGAIAVLYCLYIADAAGAFDALTWITRRVQIGSMFGSHGAITVSGVLLGVVLLPGSPVRGHGQRMVWALGFAAFMAFAAVLLHSARDVHDMFIVNKVFATPAWSLWSVAITVWVWLAIYWVLDVLKVSRGTVWLGLAGQNALLAYILAPIIYALFVVMADAFGTTNWYAIPGRNPWAGLGRGVLLAVIICAVAGSLRRGGFTLKL